MTLETLRDHCLALTGATEDMPFGPDALVFKVCGKMFALTSLARLPSSVSFKGDPDDNLVLRDRYEVRGAWHLNKTHWNEAELSGTMPDAELLALLTASHALVVSKLPRRLRDDLPSEDAAGARTVRPTDR